MTILQRTVAATILAGPSVAIAGPVYFHKPAVPRDVFLADAADCQGLASGVAAPSQAVPYQPNLYAAGAAAFLTGFLASRERRGMIDNVLRTCMADKGYRRVEPAPETRRALAHLPKAERLDRLFALASAPEPDGKVLPR